LAGFFASVLARGIQISEKNAGKTMNSTWFANSHAYVVYICTHFPPNLQAKVFIFEGARFDFQAESIRMRDDCLLRLGSKRLLKVRAKFYHFRTVRKAKQTKFIRLKSGDVKQVYMRAKTE